jgi:hypothetical protein
MPPVICRCGCRADRLPVRRRLPLPVVDGGDGLDLHQLVPVAQDGKAAERISVTACGMTGRLPPRRRQGVL